MQTSSLRTLVAALPLLTNIALPPTAARAETHRFEPTHYHNTFSFAHEPVLTIQPGDRVITKTIDARGFDAANNKVGERSNPQTGPFFIEGAEPGDVLVIRFEKIEPSRPTAWSSSVLAPYAADPAFLRYEGEREQTTETWRIDKQRRVARVASDTIRHNGFELPLRPMLGCVGVAPARKEAVATRARVTAKSWATPWRSQWTSSSPSI